MREQGKGEQEGASEQRHARQPKSRSTLNTFFSNPPLHAPYLAASRPGNNRAGGREGTDEERGGWGATKLHQPSVGGAQRAAWAASLAQATTWLVALPCANERRAFQ